MSGGLASITGDGTGDLIAVAIPGGEPLIHKEIGEIVKAKGIPLHVDAVQSAGKLPLDLKRTAVDLLTISGHKFHGPKGVGALYVRRGITFPPFMIGGHQERNRRAGTENVAGIIGMGKAAELASVHLDEYAHRVRALRDRLEAALLESCAEVRINAIVHIRTVLPADAVVPLGWIAVGDPAFDFELPLLDAETHERTGETARLSSLAGGRPVALIFGSYT